MNDINREKAKFADSYIGRIRTFQNQLLIWGVSLNYVAIIYSTNFFPGSNSANHYKIGVTISLATWVANCLIASAYSNEHNMSVHLVKINSRFLDFGSYSKKPLKTYDVLIYVFLLLQLNWLAFYVWWANSLF